MTNVFVALANNGSPSAQSDPGFVQPVGNCQPSEACACDVGVLNPETSPLCIEAIVMLHVTVLKAVSVNLAMIGSTIDGMTGSVDANVS